MDTKVYHNPRCSKSRESLQYLEDKGRDFELVEYMKTPLSEKDLRNLLKKLKMKPFDLLRTNEAEYKTLFKGKELSDDEWIKILLEHPKLIQRPIVVRGDNAVVARPVELIDKLF